MPEKNSGKTFLKPPWQLKNAMIYLALCHLFGGVRCEWLENGWQGGLRWVKAVANFRSPQPPSI